MKKTKVDHYTDKEALEFHSQKKPGKIEISSSKNMTTKRDLALAYSPGVAAPGGGGAAGAARGAAVVVRRDGGAGAVRDGARVRGGGRVQRAAPRAHPRDDARRPRGGQPDQHAVRLRARLRQRGLVGHDARERPIKARPGRRARAPRVRRRRRKE